MKPLTLFSLIITTTLPFVCSGFSLPPTKPYRVVTPWSLREKREWTNRCRTRRSASNWDGDSSEAADKLLKVVEDLSEDQVNGKVISKMEELERALSVFLEDARGSSSGGGKISPRPPSIPPPLVALGIGDKNSLGGEQSLRKAEEALLKLRERLKEEEESLRAAEKALMKSLEEEEVLRKAEFVLQQSRAAAEKRKAEAIRRTEAAVSSAEQTRKYERKVQQAANMQRRETRGTIALGTFSNENSSFNAGNNDFYFGNNEFNEIGGIPTLYDWVQDVNGSITGKVKGSNQFMDGTTVSTSPVSTGATGGTVVTTSSGSQYYLEKKGQTTTQIGNTQGPASITTAPPGVPSISNWEILDDGGISGLTENGDYIETSPIAAGIVESGSIVTTASGSNYFLSPDYSTEGAENTNDSFRETKSVKRSGTITIPKEVKGAMGKMDRAKPRSTFSLASLGMNREALSRTNQGRAPNGMPTLTNWTINTDNTITGIITGSRNIQDGDLVTTSPIAQGERKRFGTVRTTSGSVYFLG